MPDLMMPAATPITGSVFPQAEKAGLDAAAPFAQEAQGLKQKGEDEETKQKAIAYRQLLHRGADGMRQYAQEVGQQYPDLGSQLGAEAEQFATFLQDPSLDAAKAEEYTHHFYDSANNRVKQAATVKPWAPSSMADAVELDRKKRENESDFRAPPKSWAPASMDEALQYDRGKRENALDFGGTSKSSAADRARTEKRMTALRQLPAVWSQLEDMVRANVTAPDSVDSEKFDAMAFANAQTPKWQSALVNMISRSRAQGEKYSTLRKKLSELESTAGLQATPTILGDPMLNSESYKLYQASLHGGGAGAPAPAAAPKPAPQTAIDGALTWLKDPNNKADKRRAAILAEVRKAGIDTSGL